MGLYLCVFDGEEEIDGIEVGSYSDFEAFRQTVSQLLEDDTPGNKFPILMLHSDCDGEWAPKECKLLLEELDGIIEQFRQLAPVEFHSRWQGEVARSINLEPTRLYDSFIDVDGNPLLERLQNLCELAVRENLPILFQ